MSGLYTRAEGANLGTRRIQMKLSGKRTLPRINSGKFREEYRRCNARWSSSFERSLRKAYRDHSGESLRFTYRGARYSSCAFLIRLQLWSQGACSRNIASKLADSRVNKRIKKAHEEYRAPL